MSDRQVMRPIDLTIVQRTVALSCSKIGQQIADQLPWFHIIRILPSVEELEAELSGGNDE